jgi:predicted signal transduction protein with EAL and GGDEF domain
VLTRGLAVRDAAGRATRLAGSFTDITEGKEADSLTSLSSRVLFMDRLVHYIETARRRRNFSYAVLLLELHGLKVVNDTHGRPIGDRLLVAVAGRLDHRARMNWSSGRTGADRALPDARPTVARIDGDEFAILLPGVRSVGEATRVAEGIHDGFTQPVVLEGHEVYVTANVGILASAANYAAPEDVLRDAGMALSMAKAHGRSRHEVFEPEMRDRILVRQKVESSLHPALERREFRLHYQPIVRLDRETLVGFEALLRWQHPERGLLQPDEFVPLAEEADLIVGIGRWVLREACRQLVVWRDAGLGIGHLCIGINLSSKEFQQSDLVGYIGEVLREFRLDGRRIEVEITESTAMARPELVVARLSQLRALGVSVCLDDFGAGHSSLAYLHRALVKAGVVIAKADPALGPVVPNGESDAHEHH